MIYRDIPHFIMKNDAQKSDVPFCEVVTKDILKDIVYKTTGKSEFTCEYVEKSYQDDFLQKGYNRGRMAIMHFQDEISYISFSEVEIKSRNSSVQSVPTAFNIFYLNPFKKKKLYYYFLDFKGKADTNYHILMYRLMKTIGFTFLNDVESIGMEIVPFATVEDIMYTRRANSEKNKGNNSTYITVNSANHYDIYGKTYGASKYETSLMCYALCALAQSNYTLTLYEFTEGNLRKLPKPSRDVLKKMGNMNIISTGMQLEKKEFIENNSLRSPVYIYNLLNRLGQKHCALCNCEIPELIQGAHIFPVAKIKKMEHLPFEQRLEYATDGENGLWLCENHHKMFDDGLIHINNDGTVSYRDNLEQRYLNFMNEVTTTRALPKEYLTDSFLRYLQWRNGVAV